MIKRDAIVAAARSWLGTPYRHQGRAKGSAIDCIGLVWGVAADIGYRRDIPSAYSRSPGGGQIERGCEEMLKRRDPLAYEPGGIVIFYGISREDAQHFAILADAAGGVNMIHAFSRHMKVVEEPLSSFWRKRALRSYEYPDTEPYVNPYAGT